LRDPVDGGFSRMQESTSASATASQDDDEHVVDGVRFPCITAFSLYARSGAVASL
jgi:hypothetical protein